MKILMALDPGASLSKVIVKVEGKRKPYLITMSPEVALVNRTAIDSYRSRFAGLGSPKPEDDSWLEWGGQFFVVGSLARDFRGDAGLKDLKYERAVYKAAAAVGVVVQKLGKIPDKGVAVGAAETENLSVDVTLDLAVLLTWAEYQDQDRFKERLKQVLSDFTFRGLNIKVNLERLMCRPEGSGLVMSKIMKKGPNWLSDRTLAVLMFGYRNVTALIFKDGRMVSGESPDLGFFRMEEKVIARTSGQQPLVLARAIFRAYYTLLMHPGDITNPLKMEDLPVIQDLARSRDAELRAKEVQEITEAIADSHRDYWQELTNWLDGVLPSELDEVMICGGSSICLKLELEVYFGGHSRQYKLPKPNTLQNRAKASINWSIDANLEIENVFDLKSARQQEEALAFRLVDIYGLFAYFSNRQEAAA